MDRETATKIASGLNTQSAPAVRACHLCASTDGLYDCDSCGKPACGEHTSRTVAYGMDWIGCDGCRR